MTETSKGTKREVAYHQRLPRLGPACLLCLKLGFKGGLAVLRRLQGRLVVLLLVGQLLGQVVTLQD